eukprot:984148-Rhodomonas_salina.2
MQLSARRGRLLPFEVDEAQLCRTREHFALAGAADEVLSVPAVRALRLQEVIQHLRRVEHQHSLHEPLHDADLPKKHGGAEDGVDGAGNLEDVGL